MKPYEIEIFDRHYNYRSNALINGADFNTAFDALSVDKNTIVVTNGKIKVREPAESGTTGDNTVACSDYIRIISDKAEYVGIVTNIEEKQNTIVLTHEPLHRLLNHQVIVIADDIKHTNIESYIKGIITQEFIGNADTFQNIPNLSISTTSATTGLMDYNDTSEVYVIINILNDLIYPAFREYLIKTEISIDFELKVLSITIGEINNTSITIESDLPNVVDKNFTIRKSSSMVNKLSLYDTKNYALAEYNFYLHPSDYSFDSINNSDRFFPVVNQVGEFDSDAITEDEFLETAVSSARTLSKYVDIQRDLSANEIAELQSAMSDFLPYLKASKTTDEWASYYQSIGEVFHNYIFTYWYGLAGNGYERVESYDDLNEPRSQGKYFYTTDPWRAAPNGYTVFAKHNNDYGQPIVSGLSTDYPNGLVYIHPPGAWETFDFYGNVDYNTNTHAAFSQDLVFVVNLRDWNTTDEITTYKMHTKIYIGITPQMVSSALNAYKQTAEFQAAFAAYKAQNFAAIISGYAKKVFKASKYTNLIELTVPSNDSMIKPFEMEIGQVANIIHDNVSYNSILSGKEIKGGLVKLIFGTIRLELTKILNMKGI